MADQLPDPIPAATLVLFRETGAAPPDLLFVERAHTMTLPAGAVVFPGGRVDPGDHDLARRLGGDLADMAARAAAVREHIEEAGIAVGTGPAPEVRKWVVEVKGVSAKRS